MGELTVDTISVILPQTSRITHRFVQTVIQSRDVLLGSSLKSTSISTSQPQSPSFMIMTMKADAIYTKDSRFNIELSPVNPISHYSRR